MSKLITLKIEDFLKIKEKLDEEGIIYEVYEQVGNNKEFDCHVCEKKYSASQITSERIGISLYYYCNKCFKIDKETRTKFARVNRDKQIQDEYLAELHKDKTNNLKKD